MATAEAKSIKTIALVGNPNTGKSSLFNALSGLNQRVGNYPGVTVEKKTGLLSIGQLQIHLVDLPGTYSLAPKSPDEIVALRVLVGEQVDVDTPDLIVCVVDANNLERNLFLASQVLDVGVPVVIALNMIDIAENNKISVNSRLLSERLGVPVVEIQANRRRGIEDLKATIESHLLTETRGAANNGLPANVQSEISKIDSLLDPLGHHCQTRFLAQRLLLDGSGLVRSIVDSKPAIVERVTRSRDRLKEQGIQLTAIESISRYQKINELIDGVVQREETSQPSLTDRIDHILTHKLWGSLAFVFVMILVFQAIFTWSVPLMDWIDGIVGQLSEFVSARMADGAIRSLVTDGVIAGVGSVIIFLPQILILFFFIALLEDCGYMARAAYLMDKLMSKVGLSGKSFIPLLSSFACAIPGIMATRVIEGRRDRLITMLVAPLMSCSARLPVYILLIAAFVPATYLLGGWIGLQPLIMFSMYALGVAVAVAVAWLLRKTVLKGETPPFVMELPDYKIPSLSIVLTRMFQQGWAFLRRAGTLIFAVAIVVWALSYFPHHSSIKTSITAKYDNVTTKGADGREYIGKELKEVVVAREVSGEYLRQSYLARMGRVIEPIVQPLGWDWKVASAVVAAFPAREVVVGTLGVLYNVGDDADETSDSLRERLQNATWDGTDRKVFNLPMALGLMVFFALCAQCVSTLVVMKKESGGYLWPIFTFIYMTILAYLGALVTYQVGMMWTG